MCTPSTLAVSPVASESSTSVISNMDDDNIALPTHWRPEVEFCLQEKNFSNSARNDIVRTLVGLLFSKSPKPSRVQCEDLAKKLILKYPFARDDLGNGYVCYHIATLVCKPGLVFQLIVFVPLFSNCGKSPWLTGLLGPSVKCIPHSYYVGSE